MAFYASKGSVPSIMVGASNWEVGVANLNAFAHWLKDAMRRADLNQAGLAAKAGVSAPTVSAWLHARVEPNEENCRGIARALRVPVEDVYAALGRIPSGDDEMTPEERQILAIIRGMNQRQQEAAARVFLELREYLDRLEEEGSDEPGGGGS